MFLSCPVSRPRTDQYRKITALHSSPWRPTVCTKDRILHRVKGTAWGGHRTLTREGYPHLEISLQALSLCSKTGSTQVRQDANLHSSVPVTHQVTWPPKAFSSLSASFPRAWLQGEHCHRRWRAGTLTCSNAMEPASGKSLHVPSSRYLLNGETSLSSSMLSSMLNHKHGRFLQSTGPDSRTCAGQPRTHHGKTHIPLSAHPALCPRGNGHYSRSPRPSGGDVGGRCALCRGLMLCPSLWSKSPLWGLESTLNFLWLHWDSLFKAVNARCPAL